MEKIKVIFRKVKSGEFKGTIDAVFPDLPATFGRRVVYSHIGQHSEGSLEWYHSRTVKALPNEYKDLYEELEKVYNDCELIIAHRMTRPKFNHGKVEHLPDV